MGDVVAYNREIKKQLLLNHEQQHLEVLTEIKGLTLHVTQQKAASQTMRTWASKEREAGGKPEAQRR